MKGFWKWLMHANARGILVAAVLVLLLSAGWWGREELDSARNVFTLPTGNGGGLGARQPVRLGVLDYVNEQLAVDPRMVPHTPFRPSTGPRVVHQAVVPGRRPLDTVQIDGGIAILPDEVPVAGSVVVDDAAIGDALDGLGVTTRRPRRWTRRKRPGPATAGAAAQVPSAPPATLSYHGLIKRPDGVRVGVVAENGLSRFVRVGDVIAGVEVESFESDRVRLRQADHAVILLPVGAEVSVADGLQRSE
jgi:hypothetical protein